LALPFGVLQVAEVRIDLGGDGVDLASHHWLEALQSRRVDLHRTVAGRNRGSGMGAPLTDIEIGAPPSDVAMAVVEERTASAIWPRSWARRRPKSDAIWPQWVLKSTELGPKYRTVVASFTRPCNSARMASNCCWAAPAYWRNLAGFPRMTVTATSLSGRSSASQ